jgi:hypothetical protein
MADVSNAENPARASCRKLPFMRRRGPVVGDRSAHQSDHVERGVERP